MSACTLMLCTHFRNVSQAITDLTGGCKWEQCRWECYVMTPYPQCNLGRPKKTAAHTYIMKPHYLWITNSNTSRICDNWISIVTMILNRCNDCYFPLMFKLLYFEYIKGCWLWADTVSPSQLPLEGKMKWYALCESELLWWHCVFN